MIDEQHVQLPVSSNLAVASHLHFEMQDRNLEHLIHEVDDSKVQIISHDIR